jgi:arsenate reductase
MAEGILNHLYSDHYKAFSAGILPTQVNPFTIQVLKEIKIDLSNHRAKAIQKYKDKQFDVVVTVCDNAKETCPFFPGKNVVHKSFSDPTTQDGSLDEILRSFQRVRDEILHWIVTTFGKKQR